MPENPALVEQAVRLLGAPVVSVLVTLWILQRRNGNGGNGNGKPAAPAHGDEYGALIGHLRSSKDFDTLLRDRIRETHEVKSLDAAQAMLAKALNEQRQEFEGHVVELQKDHDRLGHVEIGLQTLKERFLEAREENRNEHAETRQQVRELTQALSEQSGEFRAATGEFKLLREMLEKRLREAS